MYYYFCMRKDELQVLRKASEQEVNEIKQKVSVVGRFIKDVERIKIVDKSYDKMVQSMDDYLYSKKEVEVDDINKYMTDFLFATKTFSDHWKTYISREFKEDVDYNKLYSSATADEYDNYMEYRIAYRLRNYVQHVGYMLSGITRSIKEDETIELKIYADRDKLLNSFKEWKPEEREYLSAQEKNIEIFPFLKKANECFHRIHHKLVNYQMNHEYLDLCADLVILTQEFGNKSDDIAIGEVNQEIDTNFFKCGNKNIKFTLLFTKYCRELLMQHIERNKEVVKIFNFTGFISKEKSTGFPYVISNVPQNDLIVTSSEIVDVNYERWVRLFEIRKWDEYASPFLSVYARGSLGIKKLEELAKYYKKFCKALYQKSS